MSRIQYIILSDIHLGGYNSLLTYIQEIPRNPNGTRYNVDAQKTSPVLRDLADCIKEIVNSINKGGKPQIILLGDVLELALGGLNDAAMTFERFLECMYSGKNSPFSNQILYLPGNHDHHLWETAREKQYASYISKLKPKDHISAPWHTTKMVHPDLIESDLLTDLFRRNHKSKQGKVMIAYPNYEIRGKSGRSIFLTHGNFLENIYSLMSSIQRILLPELSGSEGLKSKKKSGFLSRIARMLPFQSVPEPNRPDSIYELEHENFAWIDFFWSTLGRSGKVGKGVGLIYDMLQDEKAVGKLSDNISGYLLRKLKVFPFFKTMVRYALSFFLKKAILNVGQSERGMSDSVLSQEVIENLNFYLDTILPNQWKAETRREFPTDYSFIFGHTHKPFETLSEDLGLEIRSVPVYNTGGWVVDTIHKMKTHGGAVLLVDDDANVVSFHAYTEGDIRSSFHIPEGYRNPLYTDLLAKVNLEGRSFKKLSQSIESEIELRRKVLRARVVE